MKTPEAEAEVASHDLLAPCPFCGGNDIVYEFACSQGYFMCRDCGASGPEDEEAADPACSIEAASRAWNRRAERLCGGITQHRRTMSNHDAPGGDCPPTICSLRKLMERSSEKRKGFFRRYEADPTDIEARDGYFYQEGYNKALLEMAQIIRAER